jgi:type VI secretion system protein ImpK
MHLSDCFIKTLAYVGCFNKAVLVGAFGYEQVKGDIQALFKESDALLRQGNFNKDEYDMARFAVCALVDEAVLKSPWPHRHLWLQEQLQRSYYNTTDAGEEFFQRLSMLGLHQREAREVYYLCLALGFTGRYCHVGDEYQLEQVKMSALKLLLGSSVGLPSLERNDLFPEAHPSAPIQPGAKRMRAGSRMLVGLCLVGPVMLFGLLYLVYRFTLAGVGSNFLRTVAG